MELQTVPNFIDGEARPAESGEWLEKLRPADGSALCRVARSGAADVDAAVQAARAAQEAWAERTVVERGDLVREIALALRERREELAAVVVEETGKAEALALGEADAAVELGLFVAGEGRRYYGRTTTASTPHRTVMAVRQPVGVAGLLISFNTPLPNVAWKVFPAIFCGNGAVLKPSEETPLSAQPVRDASATRSVCRRASSTSYRGSASEAGAALVEHPQVDLVSFTGSAATGRWIAETAGRRLAKVCLELGGKNALVVCDDADLDNAVRWAVQSSFSNAGQRCAAASRIVVFDAVYDEFRRRFVEAAQAFADTGPVISEASLERILDALAREAGATVLCGGERLERDGWWLAPTVVEGVAAGRRALVHRALRPGDDPLPRAATWQRRSPSSTTRRTASRAAVHTASLHRAMLFAEKAEAGVVVVNGGTHGSEPHMGFGGVKQSGTGWREPGVEALDVYSEWKYVNLISDPRSHDA